jgi:CO dehydrogenase maturation factor
LSEGIDFDLIAMGRGEGRGCYCAVNHNLREVIDAIGDHYSYVVVDNEAGMEHLSRRTTRDVQHLLIVSDPTQRGIVAAGRIAGFRDELDINIENAHLIINRLPGGEMPPALREAVDALDVPLLGTIPETRDVTEFEFSGRPLVEMKDDSPVYQAVAAMLERIL